jgi:Holliday junction DNA helicase RuvA
MYEYLTGRLVTAGPDEVVIDVGGVGYRMTVSGATLSRLPPAGETITLYAWHLLRDDHALLFGFASREERALFERLCAVSKVGPATAMSMLSAMSPAALAAAIDAGDVAGLSRIKGIGKRTAERLCVELRDRLGPLPDLPGPVRDQRAAVAAALTALGFQRRPAVEAATATLAEAGKDTALDQLVMLALRRIGSKQATTGRPG